MLKKQAIQIILKIFFLALISSIIALNFISCKHKPTPPVWNGKIYRFDSTQPQIYRKLNGVVVDSIQLPDPKMKSWSALSDEDLKALFMIINDCQAWPGDVQYYKKALDSCGLMTKENQNTIKNCLENYQE